MPQHDFQRSQVFLLAPHQDEAKQSRRCSLRFPICVAIRTCLANFFWSILDTWTNVVAAISRFGEVARLPQRIATYL